MGFRFQQTYWNGVSYFGDFGVRIFWQVGSLGIENIGRFAVQNESKVRVLY